MERNWKLVTYPSSALYEKLSFKCGLTVWKWELIPIFLPLVLYFHVVVVLEPYVRVVYVLRTDNRCLSQCSQLHIFT